MEKGKRKYIKLKIEKNHFGVSRAFRIFRCPKFRTSTLRRSKVSLAELAGGTIERKIRRDVFRWVCGSAITRRGD